MVKNRTARGVKKDCMIVFTLYLLSIEERACIVDCVNIMIMR